MSAPDLGGSFTNLHGSACRTLAATQKRTPSLAGNDLFLTSTSQQQQPPPPPQQQQQVPFGNEIRRKFA
ncbi:unnamed protein product [Lampetra planeri]